MSGPTRPPQGPAPAGRWLARLLWPAMVVQAAALAWRAHDELRRDFVVNGLTRTYLPPIEVTDGWIIDRHPRPLVDEICARYGPVAPNPGPCAPDAASRGEGRGDDPVALIAALGIETHPRRGLGDGEWPWLLLGEASPLLQIGTYEAQPVVFFPQRGTVLLGTRVPWHSGPALELRVRESPW